MDYEIKRILCEDNAIEYCNAIWYLFKSISAWIINLLAIHHDVYRVISLSWEYNEINISLLDTNDWKSLLTVSIGSIIK